MLPRVRGLGRPARVTQLDDQGRPIPDNLSLAVVDEKLWTYADDKQDLRQKMEPKVGSSRNRIIRRFSERHHQMDPDGE